jgi:hypothetical protein
MFLKNPVLSAKWYEISDFQKKCVGFCPFCPLRDVSAWTETTVICIFDTVVTLL